MKKQTINNNKKVKVMRTKVLTQIAIILLGLSSLVKAEDLTQTIRGTVIDHDSKTPLMGATIVVVGPDVMLGTISDLEGNFKIERVPVGRLDVKVSFIGYEEKIISNILVGSGKEIVLNVEIVESVEELEEVVIAAKKNKTETLNEMAPISAKAFTVEETSRYAGSFNDPARMVSGYAGVTGDAQGNNDIVVRGNSPKGILWRLEGIEIPNPNHFAFEGGTGGPINALNSAMLSNSDFYSGAFAPEYGNAFSGVFDMRLRNGNNEKREYSFSAGILGTDFTAEGPFVKGGNSSYLVNYRYSTLAVLDDLGVVDYNGVPKYQDGSFKILVPTNHFGDFSVFGLFGKSKIFQQDIEDEDEEMMDFVYSKVDFGADLAIVGIRNTYLINDKTYVKSTLSFSNTGNSILEHERDDNGNFYVDGRHNLSNSAKKITVTLNNKFNAKNRLQSGVLYTDLGYSFKSEDYINRWDRMITQLDASGNTGLIQAYTSWKHRLNENLTVISGVHYTHMVLNDNNSIEPRVSLKWKIRENQSITAGFGVHSKVETISTYLSKVNLEDGTVLSPNENIELAKARHYVVGYDNLITTNTHFKVELYYQDLYDIPVENDPTSSYSVLNETMGWSDVVLVNEGTGTNYGTEITLERFFSNGYYYLATASLYESKYTALDGVERDARFNGNYAGNLLAGKEFKIGNPSKGRVLGINTKICLIGGILYTPINLEESIAQEREVRFDDRPFSEKGSDLFKVDFAITLRRDKNNTTREWKIDIQNITNNQGLVTQYYSNRKQEIVDSYQLPIFPVVSYKIEF